MIIIAINNSNEKVEVNIPYDFTGKIPFDIWNDELVKESSKIELAPYCFSIIQVK